MAKNAIAKAFNGFVVYKAEDSVNLTALNQVEGFEVYHYQIAEDDQVSSIGFEPVVEMEITEDGEILREEEYVLSVNDFNVIKIKQSKRKVPGAEVKKLVASKSKQAIADAQARGEVLKINKDMKEFFKEEAIKELLPRCFIDEFSTYVFQDKATNLVYVVVPSHKKAEDITAFLRRVLGSFAVIPLTTERPFDQALTSFVTQQLQAKLTLGNLVQMQDDEGIVDWKKESLYNSEAKELIDNTEKRVTKLGLDYDGVLQFTVDQELVFSGLKFEDYVTVDGYDFASTFLLIVKEITGAVKELLKEAGENQDSE